MTKLDAIRISKEFRRDADSLLQRMKQHGKELIGNTDDKSSFENHSEAIAQNVLSFRDLEACIMRQGLVLKNIGGENPYPESYNPQSAKVELPADGIKL